MKHRPGFALYEVVVGMAFIALIGVFYGVVSWANEIMYYRELSRQRTVGFTDFVLCAGPNKIECAEDQICEVKKKHKDAFGTCL